jgi:hypothetical protein
MNRKKGRREIAGQASLQGERAGRGSPDVDFDRRVIERSKKTEPLDMIHVKVGKKNINPSNRG